MKRILLAIGAGAVAAGMSVAPAYADDKDDYKSDDPSVSVHVYDNRVKVEYSCDTEKHRDKDRDRDRDRDRDKDKYGKLTVKFGHDDHRKWVRCDGRDHDVWYKVYGKGKFEAIIEDPDGDKEYDWEWVKGRKGDH